MGIPTGVRQRERCREIEEIMAISFQNYVRYINLQIKKLKENKTEKLKETPHNATQYIQTVERQIILKAAREMQFTICKGFSVI